MVLTDLGRSLGGILNNLVSNQSSKERALKEESIDALIKDICQALLAADVNVKQVSLLRKRVKERLLSTSNEATDSSTTNNQSQEITARMARSVVVEELVNLLDSKTKPFVPERNRCNVIMTVGLQGSGKTTTCSKIASYYGRKGWKVGLICADTFRAGAYAQLKQNAAKSRTPFFGTEVEGADPVEVVKQGLDRFKSDNYEIIIVDTSGRHSQETALFAEMQEIAAVANPDTIILVLDGSIGQAAQLHAQAFKEAVSVGSVVITKMDGHARGGGALSAVASTGAPIVFVGVGEHLHDLEPFSARSFISRLLGMGDIQGLMDTVTSATDMQQQADMIQRLQTGGAFTLRDMYSQFETIIGMGPLSRVMSMMPGLNNSELFNNTTDQEASQKLRQCMTIMDSMTRSELDSDGKVFNTQSNRTLRIALGSGCSLEAVQMLLTQYRQFANMIKKLGGAAASGNFASLMGGANGGAGRSRVPQRNGSGGSPMMAEMQQMMQQMGGMDQMMQQMGGMEEMMKQMGGMEGLMKQMNAGRGNTNSKRK